jgi:thioredoxin-related protein
MKSFLLRISLMLSLVTAGLRASPPEWADDVSKALSQAKKQEKLGFILMGREQCSNCQATKAMVNEGKVPVSAETFVVAEVNIDDTRDRAEFEREFRKEKFGDTLPFVVITDSKGKPLASYSGYKSPADLTSLINEASARAKGAKEAKK